MVESMDGEYDMCMLLTIFSWRINISELPSSRALHIGRAASSFSLFKASDNRRQATDTCYG